MNDPTQRAHNGITAHPEKRPRADENKIPVGALVQLPDLQQCMYNPVPLWALLFDKKKALSNTPSPDIATMDRKLRDDIELFYRTLYPLYGVDEDLNIKDFCLEEDENGRGIQIDRIPPIPTGKMDIVSPLGTEAHRSLCNESRTSSHTSVHHGQKNQHKVSEGGAGGNCSSRHPRDAIHAIHDHKDLHVSTRGSQDPSTRFIYNTENPGGTLPTTNVIRNYADRSNAHINASNSTTFSSAQHKPVMAGTQSEPVVEDPFEAYRRRAATMAKQQRDFGGAARCSYFHTREGCRRGHRCPYLHEV